MLFQVVKIKIGIVIHQFTTEHYKDNTWVAGYNLLNEPASADHSKLVNFYLRVEEAIRKVDPNHIFFLDGNTYAMDFSQFPKDPAKVFPNTVFAIHDYAKYGFPASNEKYVGSDEQKGKLKHQYERKVQYMKQNNLPVWNGEFGPVYASTFRGDGDPEATNKVRYHVLKDQLDVYKHGDPSGDGAAIGWSIWLYKDIGYQGLTYVNPDSKFYKIFGDWLLKKKKLGLDSWGNDIDPEYKKVYTTVADHFKEVVPEKYHRALYPHGLYYDLPTYVTRVLKDMLLSQYFQHEYAELFEGLSFEELDELAACFKIENVAKRDELNAILRSY
ncbi:unnamed protein product [Ambrosiozyma monospora]|uniref:Unnamed protein product n=1 Tax=Ambrosiozyma monospora TaxID=43982 RepID=A0ACB5SZ30_AMBMO|nr:unnamed protein product [Ambrosiozyma monospora]